MKYRHVYDKYIVVLLCQQKHFVTIIVFDRIQIIIISLKKRCSRVFVCEHSSNRNENATEILVRDLLLYLSRV